MNSSTTTTTPVKIEQTSPLKFEDEATQRLARPVLTLQTLHFGVAPQSRVKRIKMFASVSLVLRKQANVFACFARGGGTTKKCTACKDRLPKIPQNIQIQIQIDE